MSGALKRDEWETVRLGDVITSAPVLKCGDGSYPILSMTMHDGIVYQSERFKKDLASKDKSGYKIVKPGQLVVGFPIDEGVLYIQRYAESGIMSPAYTVWDVDYTYLDKDYFELALHGPRSMKYYASKLRGSTARRRSLPTPTFLALSLLLPPLDVQRRIADTLDKVTELITLRKTQLKKLDELVKARFVEMFGDPEHNEKGWDIKKLEKLCVVGSSKRIYQNEQSVSGVPFLRISNLVNLIDTGIKESDLYIPRELFLKLKEQGLVPTVGDILITARGTLGKCYIVKVDDEFYFQDGMISWLSKLDKVVNAVYLTHLLSQSGFRKQIDSLQAGSTVAYLSLAQTKKLDIMLPPLDLQKQFVSFVSSVEEAKSPIQQSLDALETLKKSLMQEYFG
ncbi:restriction endonuclease subunit S [Methanocorpusculum sp.]|nr:restriction endonuclease subunit S [Methanocorpusculum sp.]